VINISDWYSNIGEYSFPTIFLHLNKQEINSLCTGETEGTIVENIIARINHACKSLPGSCFVSADCVAPTDSPHYNSKSVSGGKRAWRLLTTSKKVKENFKNGNCQKIVVRPFRRIDKVKEFRLFFYQRELKAMSQYLLTRHFARFAKKREQLWQKAQTLSKNIAYLLPNENQVVDVYLCANGRLLIIDLNEWAKETDPKLLKTWELDWQKQLGLKMIEAPIKMKGDISVSF